MAEKRILPPVAAELWDLFARNANWSMLHQLDWERFFRFVVWTHRHCPRVHEGDIRALLDARGLSREHGVARDLPSEYTLCRGVLNVGRRTSPALRWSSG